MPNLIEPCLVVAHVAGRPTFSNPKIEALAKKLDQRRAAENQQMGLTTETQAADHDSNLPK